MSPRPSLINLVSLATELSHCLHLTLRSRRTYTAALNLGGPRESLAGFREGVETSVRSELDSRLSS